MRLNRTLWLQLLVLLIAILVIALPLVLFLCSATSIGKHVEVPHENVSVIFRTFLWSLSVGFLATAIGWPVGLRVATLRRPAFSAFVLTLLMSLAVPAYAVYYAWWQLWPSGSWLHQTIVRHDLLAFSMKTCVLMALVGWSWPIPALLAAMSNRNSNGLMVLHSIDNPTILKRMVNRFCVEKKLLLSSVILVGALTATNTTCFDLAQIATLGNELRAVISAGGTIMSAPWLSIAGLFFAVLALFAIFNCRTHHQHQTLRQYKTITPILFVWVLLTGGPLLISALTSLRSDGFQLWSQYGGDLFVSATIAFFVAITICLIVVSSMAIHLSSCARMKVLANGIDVVWILVACLPASLIASVVGHAWHLVNLDFVDRTPVILILAQVSRIGFVGSLAGRWVAHCPDTKTLCQLDSPRSILSLLSATCPRLLQAMSVALAISIAMSFGEVALTTQLAPPSTHQPISVALLNAMHYQRPQLVTSALFVMIAIATVGGLFLFVLNRKFVLSMVLFALVISCKSNEQKPMRDAVLAGSVGKSEGHFITPRAIDSDDQVIVVIDKTGRLQRFSHDGTFLSSWDLELSGTGFPTGVSIDKERNIWIADTHQHRILVLDSQGEEILEFGEYGIEEGQFLYPTDIAFGINGEVFVSEYGGNDRISVFTQDGIFVRSIGEHGEGIASFRRPQSIAIDPNSGYLYITDSGNHRVVVLKPDGEVVTTISKVGRLKTEMLYPYGIVMDSPDTFIVCEFGNNRLQRFSLAGESIETWGSAGDTVGLLRTPWGIATTAEGIVIADTGNNRLQLLPDMMSTQ